MALNKKALISVGVYAGSFAVGVAAAIGINKLISTYQNSYSQRRKRTMKGIVDCEYDVREDYILIACYEKEMKELEIEKATLAIDDPTSGEKIVKLDLRIEALKSVIKRTYEEIATIEANVVRVEHKYKLTDVEIDDLYEKAEQKYNQDYKQ